MTKKRDSLQNTLECYELARQLKTEDVVMTCDGWAVQYLGKGKDYFQQFVQATKGNEIHKLQHYQGSEGIARLLHSIRNPNGIHPRPGITEVYLRRTGIQP